jgi:hypothetical protein
MRKISERGVHPVGANFGIMPKLTLPFNYLPTINREEPNNREEP